MSDASHSRSVSIDPTRESIAHIQRVDGGKTGVAFVPNRVREIVLSGVAGLPPRRSARMRKSSCGQRIQADARSTPDCSGKAVRAVVRNGHGRGVKLTGLTSLAIAKAGSHASRRITREL